MTDYTPILNLPQVAPNQDQKEATINTAISILEAAMNDLLAYEVTGASHTLTLDEYTKYFLFQFSPATGFGAGSVDVYVPNTPRWFAVENQTSVSINLSVDGAGGAVIELASGKIGLVVSDGEDLRFVVPDPTGGLGLLTDLSDVEGVPTNGQILRYYTADNAWKPWTFSIYWNDIADAPDYGFSGNNGRLLAIKADGSGLEWVSNAANVNSFVDLDDTPSSYSGHNNKHVVVNSGATGLTFAIPNLRENSDFPSSYSGQDGKFCRVASGGAIEFAYPSIASVSDGPGGPTFSEALWYIRVNAAGTALEYAPGTTGPVNFTELLDTPDSFATYGLKLLRVNVDEDAVYFDDLGFLELSDTPANYTSAENKFVRVNSGATGLQFATASVQDLSNGPGSFAGQAKKVVRVNATATALEYVALSILDLSGFPTSFTGQGGKFLQVRADESGVQFVSNTYTASFLSLTDTPSSYTGQANKMVVVDPSAAGLIFQPQPTIPTRLGHLSDVESGTGTPQQGDFLRYIDGVWQADPFPVNIPGQARYLNDLLDVEFPSSEPTEGQALIFRDGVWSAETVGTGSSNVESIGDLSDVETGTGTPAEGDVLTWKDGVWQAEPPPASGGGGSSDVASLGDLTDVEVSTGPFAGDVLTYRDGIWQAEPASAGVTSLAALTDVEIQSGQPASGEALIFDETDGLWKPFPVFLNGPTAKTFGAHSYWRIVALESTGTTYFGVNELEFRPYAGGTDQANGGTAISSGNSIDYFDYYAFDNTLGLVSRWSAPVPYYGEWIGYHFAEPVSVGAVAIYPPPSYTTADESPKRFTVEYSDDGSSWTVAWEVQDQTGWVSGVAREFTPAALTSGISFLQLNDAPDAYDGAGKAVRVNASNDGLEFYTPSYSLIDLDDVELATPTPQQGDVLTYHDGVWQALPNDSTTPFIPTVLGELGDVETGTGTPSEGDVLTYKDGVWQAEPAPSGGSGGGSGGGATSLGELTDVETGTAPVEGYVLTYKDGIWQAEPAPIGGGGGSGANYLSDLLDVEFGTAAAENDLLVYHNGVWEVRSPLHIGLTEEAPSDEGIYGRKDGAWELILPGAGAVSAAKWRLYITEAQGPSSYVNISEFELHETVGGPDLVDTVGGGTITSGSDYAGFTAKENAFDNNSSTRWGPALGAQNTGLAWVAYNFLTPQVVREVLVRASTFTAEAPKSFKVQFSDDGVTWTDFISVSGQTGWTSTQARSFSAELYGVYGGTSFVYEANRDGKMYGRKDGAWAQVDFLNLKDTPTTYTGQQSKFVKVNAAQTGLEFVSVLIPTALDHLADVELGTGTPADGYVLTYKDGIWQAEPPPAGAGGGGGASYFTDLLDTPGSYSGSGSKLVAVKSDASGIEFVTPSSVTNWWFDPPAAADFGTTKGSHGAGMVLTDNADAGLLVDCGAPATGDNPFGRLKSITSPTADWEVRARLVTTSRKGNYSGIGLTLCNTSATKIIVFRVEYNAAIGGPYVGGFNLPSGFISNPGDGSNVNFNSYDFFMRIKHLNATSQLEYAISNDGKNWQVFYTETDTNILGFVPNLVGIGGFNNRSSNRNYFSVPYWYQSW